jgi:hypothetical protein
MENLGFDPREREEIFLFSLQALESNVYQGIFPGVKRPKCESDHFPPSSTEKKNAWSYVSVPSYF